MRVITIGSDRKIFERGSAVRARVVEYAGLFEEMHIIVFNNRFKIQDSRFKKEQIAGNAWVYPTNSWSRWLYVWDAIRIGKSIVKGQMPRPSEAPSEDGSKVNDWVIDAQDPFECGLVASRIARRFDLPLHIQIHTDFLSPFFASVSFLNRVRVFIAREILPRANGIRVVSERIRSSLSNVNCQMSKVSVLSIFTDLKKFQNASPPLDLKQKYPEWSFIIVAAGRFSAEKNFGFAIAVLKELLKTYPKTGLVIIGEGLMEKNLKSKVKSQKLEENVAFEPWQGDLVSYYKTANLFLQTSLYEGFGLALLEAVASGCPAVSSDVGIAPELLNHKGHSFICPVNDLDCFVRTISELIEDNQLRTFFSLEIAPIAVAPFIQTKEAYLGVYKASLEHAQK